MVVDALACFQCSRDDFRLGKVVVALQFVDAFSNEPAVDFRAWQSKGSLNISSLGLTQPIDYFLKKASHLASNCSSVSTFCDDSDRPIMCLLVATAAALGLNETKLIKRLLASDSILQGRLKSICIE